MPITEEDRRVLLALIWSLKHSDLSTLETLLKSEQRGSVMTTKTSCHAKFWSELVRMGLAEEALPPQLELEGPALKLFAGVTTFALTPEGRAVVAENFEFAGWPPRDSVVPAEVLQILRQYAEEGDAPSQSKLAVLYQDGTGVPQDIEEALKWYRQAAERGDTTALTNLGVIYFAGQGVPRDFAEAMKWSLKAAELGNLAGMENVGSLHLLGAGVPQDYAEAAKWYRKAAEGGRAAAQFGLANLYEQGQGVAQDDVQAYVWYSLALAAGVNAKARRDAVAARMGPEQIAEAELLVSQWAVAR